MKRTELSNFLTYLCLFLLPWPTVWIYDSLTLGGEVWEYGKLTHYAVQFLIVAAALVRWEIKRNDGTKKNLRSGWLFLSAVLVSCGLSIDWRLSGGFFLHLFSAGLLFWLLLDGRIETKKIIWFFSLGLIVPCFLGWWQIFFGWSPASTLFGLAGHLVGAPGTSVVEAAGERLMRAYGSFPHPNIFGGYLAMAILFIISKNKLLHSTTPRLHDSIVLTILALFAVTLVITFSRSAWLALAVGIILFFVVGAVFRKKIPRQFLSGLAIVVIAAATSAALFSNAVFTRVAATDRLEEKSIIERRDEYKTVGEVIKINPFVGVGPGAYTRALEKLHPGQPVWSYQPMHNSFLLFFAETGLLGLVFLTWFLWAAIEAIRPCLNALAPFSARTPLSQATPLVAALTTLALLDHYLWSQWAGLALAVVVFALILRFRDSY